MVVENQAPLRSRICDVLSDAGHDVTGFEDATPALKVLENAKKNDGNDQFFLIIAGFSLPAMSGDSFLSRAREICPRPMRMLIADTAYIDTMISAVNTARIQACLTQPFENEDLVNQVDHCGLSFHTALKMENLNKTIKRQNRQLFQIAGNFKKKEAADRAQMAARNKELRLLQARLKSDGDSSRQETIPFLEEILSAKGIDYTATAFALEFQKMADQVREILATALLDQGKEPLPLSYQDVVFRSGQVREYPETVKQLLAPLRMLIHQSREMGLNLFGIDFKRHMDAHFKITLSQSRAKAIIRVTRLNPKLLNLTCIKYYLAWYKISYGITSDDKICAWLKSLAKKKDPENIAPFLIARGQEPVYPSDGEIRYHFPTDFLHAGKINDDGSINFRDRGEIPFVKANTFLAAKRSASKGKPGVDVTGKKIPVQDPVEKTFEAGPGTVLSDDGQKIYAACDGQPHLDARGRISVCPEMAIDGDLGFETGDVIFDGNVVVNGRVKEGFKVKCASLTALEIQGAEVDITGDLNVSLGIVDTELVNVKGSVQAMFVRNSKINAFGDLIVQREIVDSYIRLSGACINTAGSIINSKISANMGIDAGGIGTDLAKPTTLTVGKDEQTQRLLAILDKDIRGNSKTMAELNRSIEQLEKQEQELHGQIAHHATVQDRSQLGINRIKEKISGLLAAGNMAAYQKLTQAMTDMETASAEAESAISKGFEQQDTIARDILEKRDHITRLQDENDKLSDEKKRLLEYTATKPPKPQIRVARTICSGTKIIGPNTTMTLFADQRYCRIIETAKKAVESGSMIFYEMKTGPY